jgi:hypothetical protein
VGRMEEVRNAYNTLVWIPEGKRPLRRHKTLLTWILKNVLTMWPDIIWLKIHTSGGLC